MPTFISAPNFITIQLKLREKGHFKNLAYMGGGRVLHRISLDFGTEKDNANFYQFTKFYYDTIKIEGKRPF